MYLNGAYYDRYPVAGVVPMRMPQPPGTAVVVQAQQQPPQWTATGTATSTAAPTPAVAPAEHPPPMGINTATTTIPTAQPPQQLFPPSHASNNKNNNNNKNSNINSESTYVLRIHEMLEDAEKEQHQYIVSWQPHGRAFKVHDEAEFVAKIMPRYFKAKIGSFRRWLRAWGFERMTEGPDRGGWYHRYFVRGMTSFCKQMARQQMLQAMDDWLPPGQVPDFYNPSSSAALSEQVMPTILTATTNNTNTNDSIIDHSSNDLGNDNDNDNENGQQDMVELSHAKNPKKLRGTVLEDLRDMLQDTEARGEQAIASWMPHGKAFKIHDKEAFAEQVMPRHFKTGKLTYFSDTLRIWGFCRFKRPGKDRNAYYHKFFVRGDPSLSRHKSREQMRKAMANWPPPDGEPNLYEEEEASSSLPTATQQQAQQQQQQQQQQQITTKRGPSANGSRPMTNRGAPKSVTVRGARLAASAPTPTITRVPQNATHDVPQGKQSLDEVEQLMFDAAASDPLHHLQDANSQQDAEQLLPPDLYYDAAHHPTDATTLGTVRAPIGTTMIAPPDDGKSGDGTYVLRIHEMLENAEKEGYQHVVSWQPHGRAFRVHREEEFIESIMPRYFKAKIDSFRRWLRAWGFNRMTEGRDRGAWYHRYFVRGVTSLCQTMTRQQMLQAMANWLPAGQVPDFYAPGTTMALSEDHSRVFDQTTAAGSQDPADQNSTAFIKNPKKLRGTVPEDLRTMLQDAQYEGNEKIVSWLSHGRAFKVHSKNQFVQKIMPRYFKATKFTYFSDTLRMWGFARLKKVPKDRGAYYHCKFVRGDAALSRHLSREQMKAAMAGYPPPEGEPDLHALVGGMVRVEAFATANVAPVSPPVPPPPPPRAIPAVAAAVAASRRNHPPARTTVARVRTRQPLQAPRRNPHQAGVPTEQAPIVQQRGVTMDPLSAPIPPASVHMMPPMAGDGKQEVIVVTSPTSPTRARHQSTRIAENIELSSQQYDSREAGPTQDTMQSSDGGNELVAADVPAHDSMEGHSASRAAAAQDDGVESEEMGPTEGEEDASHSLLVHPPSPTHTSDDKQESDDAMEEPLSAENPVEDSMEENFRIASPETVPPTEVDEDPSHSLLVHPPSPTHGHAKRKRDETWIEL